MVLDQNKSSLSLSEVCGVLHSTVLIWARGSRTCTNWSNTLWPHMGQCRLPRMLPILNARSSDADHALILEIGMGDQGKDLVVEAVRAWIQQPGSPVEHVQRDFTSTGKRKKLFLKFVAGRLGVSGVPTVLLATKILRGRPITELSASITYVDQKMRVAREL